MSEVGVESSPTQSPRPQLREIFEKDWQDPNVVLADLGIVAKLGRDLGLDPGVEKGAFDEKGVFESSWGDIYDPHDKMIGSYQRRDWHGPGTAMRTPGQPLPERKWTEVFLDVTRAGDTGRSHIGVSVWLDKSERPSTINWEEHRPGQPVQSWGATRNFDDAGRVMGISKVEDADKEKGVLRSLREEYGEDGALRLVKESFYYGPDVTGVVRREIRTIETSFDEKGNAIRRETNYDPKTGELINPSGPEKVERPPRQQPAVTSLPQGLAQPKPQGGVGGFLRKLIGR